EARQRLAGRAAVIKRRSGRRRTILRRRGHAGSAGTLWVGLGFHGPFTVERRDLRRGRQAVGYHRTVGACRSTPAITGVWPGRARAGAHRRSVGTLVVLPTHVGLLKSGFP